MNDLALNLDFHLDLDAQKPGANVSDLDLDWRPYYVHAVRLQDRAAEILGFTREQVIKRLDLIRLAEEAMAKAESIKRELIHQGVSS